MPFSTNPPSIIRHPAGRSCPTPLWLDSLPAQARTGELSSWPVLCAQQQPSGAYGFRLSHSFWFDLRFRRSFDSVSRLPSHAIRYEHIAIENPRSATASIRARAVQEDQTNLPGSNQSTSSTRWISTRCCRRPTRPRVRLHRSHHPRSPHRRCCDHRRSAQCARCRRGRHLVLANKSPPRHNRILSSSRSPPQASLTWRTAHDPYTAR